MEEKENLDAQGESSKESKGEKEKTENEETTEEKDEKESSSFGDSNMKLFVIFLIGVLLGILIKIPATKAVTIGYEDYKVDSLRSDYPKFGEKEEVEGVEMDEKAVEIEVEPEGGQIEEEMMDEGAEDELTRDCSGEAEGVVQVGAVAESKD